MTGFWRYLYDDNFLWLNKIPKIRPSRLNLLGALAIVIGFGGFAGFLIAGLIFLSIWYVLLAFGSNILGYIILSYGLYLDERVIKGKHD